EFDEQCDDGNLEDGDDCSSKCLVEPPVDCGDGIVDERDGEQCDDGNFIPGDGCSPACRLEECGNAILDPGEECEPNLVSEPNPNLDAGVPLDASVSAAGATAQGAAHAEAPACSDVCLLELYCGDGWVTAGEECDDAFDPDEACSDQ